MLSTPTRGCKLHKAQGHKIKEEDLSTKILTLLSFMTFVLICWALCFWIGASSRRLVLALSSPLVFFHLGNESLVS